MLNETARSPVLNREALKSRSHSRSIIKRRRLYYVQFCKTQRVSWKDNTVSLRVYMQTKGLFRARGSLSREIFIALSMCVRARIRVCLIISIRPKYIVQDAFGRVYIYCSGIYSSIYLFIRLFKTEFFGISESVICMILYQCMCARVLFKRVRCLCLVIESRCARFIRAYSVQQNVRCRNTGNISYHS